nr:MAG TPA: hypothetical protein [Herelleviridae sp.]
MSIGIEYFIVGAVVFALIAIGSNIAGRRLVKISVDNSVQELFSYSKFFYVYKDGRIRKYRTSYVQVEFSYLGLVVIGVYGYNPNTGREDYYAVGHGYKERGYIVSTDVNELIGKLHDGIEDLSTFDN